MKRNITLMAIIFVLHSIMQFISWSLAPGNTMVKQSNLISQLWPIFSFPLFYLVPQDWSNANFWIVFCANSIIWAVSLMGLIVILKKS